MYAVGRNRKVLNNFVGGLVRPRRIMHRRIMIKFILEK